jgi:type I restriction enzyme S subunit
MPTRWTNLRKAVALKGDIVLTVKGAGVGKINLVNSLELAISRQLMAIRPFVTDMRYVYIYLQSIAEEFQSQTTGIAIPGIGRDDVNNSLFQLPPLAEQHRIVTKVDELMAICDALKARINDAQTTQIQLADAIVEQAVA